MNDSDEDAEAERRLQQRMEAAGSSSPPNPSLLAPAALYLTAILECVPPVSVSPPLLEADLAALTQGDLRVRASLVCSPCCAISPDPRGIDMCFQT